MVTKWSGLCCLVVLGLGLGFSSQSAAQEPRNTEFFVRKAKQAMALGLVSKWKQALVQAESRFPKDAKKMPLLRRLNMKMWIYLLWSKYYRLKGEFPPVVNVGTMESKSALVQYTKLFQKAILALEKAETNLKDYNAVFAKVMQRSKWQDQIYMQASLSMLRDIQGDIRTGRVYVSFLQFASHNWGKNKKINAQLTRINKMVSSLKKNKVQVQVQAVLAKRKRRRVAKVMIQSQDSYIKEVETLQVRKRNGSILMWSGITAAVIGAALTAVGAALLVQVQQGQDPNLPAAERLRANEVQALENSAYPMVGVGGALAGTGVVLAIVGAALRPSANAAEAAVIKTHNKHIEVEREDLKRSNPTSRAPVPRLSPQRGRLPRWTRARQRRGGKPTPKFFRPSCARGGCVILGQW
ncbi:MAG: hypothetical protein EP343_30395 [Deltaproteobacteria bacterium]|nr:MAG: hypothetical protein EP343_30395 [Deltaproteobacteria bacterium]